MLIISIMPLVAGLYLTYLDVRGALRDSIGDYFQEEANGTAHKVEMVITSEVTDVQRLTISPDIRDAIRYGNYEREKINNYIRQFKSFDEKEVHSLIIADSKGDYIAGRSEGDENNFKNERWFTAAYNNGKGKVYVGDLKLDNKIGKYLMNIAAPVMDNGKAIGVVVIRYTVDNLLAIINTVRIGKSGHATLVDSKGTIIMCPMFPMGSHHVSPGLFNMITRVKPGWGVADDDAHGGKDSIVGFAPVEATIRPDYGWLDGNRWYVFIRQSPNEMYAPIYSFLARVSIFAFVLIVFLALTAVYAAGDIVKPINELYKGVELIGQGKLDHRLYIKTDDEIERLADQFNRMAEELSKTYTTLEERNKELEISEERYKDLVENSPEMIHSVNAERYFVGVNKTELNILGYTIEEMRNKRLEDIVPEEFKERVKKHVERVIKEAKSRVETQFIIKDGKKIDTEISATALYHPITSQFIKTRAFVRDITDRKRLERHLREYHEILEQRVSDRTRELKETKDYLENLLEGANDVIFTLNHEGVITYVNKKVEEWGYRKEELIGSSFLKILSKKHKGERLKRTVAEGIRQTYEVEIMNKSGEMKYAVLSISPLRGSEEEMAGVLVIAYDITERNRLEQQVAQAEKMSAIGQLAAGIAHEINNPIGGIMNCLYNLRNKRLPKEREGLYIKSMEDGIQRVQRTVEQLLDFSQQHEPQLTAIDVNNLVEDVLSLMSYAITKNVIRLKKELDLKLPKVMLDQHKIGQVVMNMLLNAVQAVKGEGEIKVSTFNEDGWCCIAITDNGTGIPPHIMSKIFDPFFTTKDVGKGTGLGLAVSLGIVEKHSGRIDVKSEEGKGSSFTIKLPLKAAG
ncbi:MAG: PAS domain S-box protein [Nitrospirae bacterium]|nr:PAS domain S-box protein [Nitrospirota bacterium]